MSAVLTSPAIRVLDAILDQLSAAGISATRDAGAFYPQPLGVLVGLPTLSGRAVATRRFEVPVLVVSGEPFNAELPVDRALALADECALALRTDNYRPTSFRSSGHAEPLPAFELTVVVSIPETEEL